MPSARLERELVIHTENRIELIGEVSRLFYDMGVNILAVNLRATGEEATLRLITSAQTYARDALRRAGFFVDEREVVVLELPERVGFLCKVAEALAREGIRIDDLYATVSTGIRTAAVVFTCSHNSKAVLMLQGR